MNWYENRSRNHRNCILFDCAGCYCMEGTEIMSNGHQHPNLFKLPRLLKEIDDLEFEFKFYCTVNDADMRETIEGKLGIRYRILMKEVTKHGLESVFDNGDSINVLIRK